MKKQRVSKFSILALIMVLSTAIQNANNKGSDCLPSKIKSISYCQRTDEKSNPIVPPYTPLFNQPSSSKEGHYRFAAVASDVEQCSTLGTRIMAVEGGSAMDAAIITTLCLGVFNPQSSGIGGGSFITFYNRSSGQVHSIIGRGKAPAAASRDWYFRKGKRIRSEGTKAIAVPGEIHSLYEAWRLGGRLPWKELFQPMIKMCKDGIEVSKTLADYMRREQNFTKRYPNFRNLITNQTTQQLYNIGDIFKRPKFARVLETIADEGPGAFYTGSLADDIIADIQEAGGVWTKKDLRDYTAIVTSPLTTQLHDNYTVYSPPLPSKGGIIYQSILKILDGYKFNTESINNVSNAVTTWHRFIEALKHSRALTTHLGDGTYQSEENKKYIFDVVATMTHDYYGESKRRLINDKRTHHYSYYKPAVNQFLDRGTTHLSVLGPNGDAVALSSSIHLYFGSKVIGSRTGIIFNNELRTFAVPDQLTPLGVIPNSGLNMLAPNKRTMSTMSPSIVVGPDGEVKLVIGASGGSKIPPSIAQVTLGVLRFGWGLKESIDYPRLYQHIFNPRVFVQPEFPEVILKGLRDIGHNTTIKDPYNAVVQAILRQGNDIIANSDYRKNGASDGY